MAITKTLFIASPTGFATGYTFTRAGVAYEIDSDGVLQEKTTDILRIDFLDLDGDGIRETPAFSLEAASTNLFTHADAFDDGDWTKNNVTVEADSGEAADGSTTADLIVPSTLANTHNVGQTLGVTDSVDHTLTIYASPGGLNFLSLQLLGNGTANAARAHFELTSSGAVVDSETVGTGTLTRTDIELLRSGVYRCTLVGQISTSTALDADFFVAETSDQMAATWAGGGSSAGLGVRLWGAQVEDDQGFATSLMLSSAAAATRSADTLFFNFTAPPQEMTVYVKFVERGSLGINNARLVAFGSAAAGDPRFFISEVGDKWSVGHDIGATVSAATLATAASVGDAVEIRAVLNADGSVLIGQSLNSGTEETATDATTQTLQSAWADTRLYINSAGTVVRGVNAFAAIKVARGTKTLAEMRSLSPFFGLLTSHIPVAQDSVDGNRQEIGDRSRTFDGTLRETIRNRVSGWSGNTIPMTLADKNEVQALLESSTQPQGSFGDMVAGSTGDFPNVFTSVTSVTPIQSGNERRYVVAFTAEASS